MAVLVSPLAWQLSPAMHQNEANRSLVTQGESIMDPLKSHPPGEAALVHASELEFLIDESLPEYQRFVGRLENDLAAMVDRWLHVSAPCAARGGLGQTPRGSRG